MHQSSVILSGVLSGTESKDDSREASMKIWLWNASIDLPRAAHSSGSTHPVTGRLHQFSDLA